MNYQSVFETEGQVGVGRTRTMARRQKYVDVLQQAGSP